jgi:hypothetical protein
MSQLVIDSRKTALVAIDLQNAVLQMNPAPACRCGSGVE